MLCDVCQKRQAKIFYTEIVNGEKSEQHLCEQCASEHTSFPLGNIADITNIGGSGAIGGILSGILSHYISGKELKNNQPEETTHEEPVCKQCGMTESEVLKYGKLGCPVCYSTFADIISKNIKATQGGSEHCGKEPHFAKMVAVNDMPVDDSEDTIVKKKGRGRKRKTEEKNTTATSILGEKDMYDMESDVELIEQLKKDLKEALAVEDYKEAAHLRDTIRYFEGKANEKKEE